MPLRTSSPPSYDKIFEIFTAGTAATSCPKYTSDSGTVLPNHRALFIVTNNTTTLTVKFYNLDHTTANPSFSTVVFPFNCNLILPVQVKFYDVTAGGSTSYIYGLI